MKRLAVLDFAGGGAEGALTGSAVAGMVQTHLSVKRGFEVVEREKFGELLAEHKLLKEGVIDEDTAQEFRKAHGIDGIITGSIIQYSREQRFQFIPLVGPVPYNQTSVAFNLRLIDTSNAQATYLCTGENSEKNKTYMEVAGKVVNLALEPLIQPDAFMAGEMVKR